MNRILVDARKNKKGFFDLTDVLTGGEITAGVLSGNPTMIAKGFAGRGIKEYIKLLNDPNRIVKKMFSKLEGVKGNRPTIADAQKQIPEMKERRIAERQAQAEKGTFLAEEQKKGKTVGEDFVIQPEKPKTTTKVLESNVRRGKEPQGSTGEIGELIRRQALKNAPQKAPNIDSGKAGLQIKNPNAKKLGTPVKKKVSKTPVKTKVPVAEIKKVAQFEKMPNLSKSDRKIETKAFNRILKEEDKILAAQKADKGNIVNTDDFRLYFKKDGYKGHNSQAVQEPSSYLSKLAYKNGLKNEGEFTVFLAGGSGAGKTSALKKLNKLDTIIQDSSVILDSNLSSYKGSVKKIKLAEAAGKSPVIIFTYRNPLDAFINGVVKRMKTNKSEFGRIVPSKITAGNHVDSLDVAKKLSDNGYKVIGIDNSLGLGNQRLVSIDEIVKKAGKQSKTDLINLFNKEIKRLYEKGDITKTQYQGYIN